MGFYGQVSIIVSYFIVWNMILDEEIQLSWLDDSKKKFRSRRIACSKL